METDDQDAATDHARRVGRLRWSGTECTYSEMDVEPSMPDEQMTMEERARAAARKQAEDLRGFLTHLTCFLAVGLAFFFLNLVTSRDSWWFFWPLLPWSVGLIIHGWNTVTNDRLLNEAWVERKAQSMLARQQPAPAPAAPRGPDDQDQATGGTIRRTEHLIDGMRTSARQIPTPEIRRQALAVCASADQVFSAIMENPAEAMLARDFLDRYLTPASRILGEYARLASRDIASARPTLAKVEEHDLPFLRTRFDELYDRLHRGRLIDLQVAREMLSIDVASWDDDSVRELRTDPRRSS